MKRAWFKDEPELFSPAFKNGDKVATLVKGQAQGRLMGGNMTCLVRLLGTPYAPDFAGAILFLEDIGEKAYRVDGMFTQLRLAGAWAQISGLVLGRFSHTDEMEQQRIDDCLRREAVAVGLPCVTGAPVGHFPEQIVVPHGARAELDATKKILRRIDS
jgi:muramoyltetrapeptide carboxypeptidase